MIARQSSDRASAELRKTDHENLLHAIAANVPTNGNEVTGLVPEGGRRETSPAPFIGQQIRRSASDQRIRPDDVIPASVSGTEPKNALFLRDSSDPDAYVAFSDEICEFINYSNWCFSRAFPTERLPKKKEHGSRRAMWHRICLTVLRGRVRSRSGTDVTRRASKKQLQVKDG